MNGFEMYQQPIFQQPFYRKLRSTNLINSTRILSLNVSSSVFNRYNTLSDEVQVECFIFVYMSTVFFPVADLPGQYQFCNRRPLALVCLHRK
jgi:hypothetical protein